MPLLSLDHLSIRFRGPPLLDDVSAVIEPGQKIGLLGRNGAGKTTLLKILAGEVTPDHGSLWWSSGAKVARLIQEVPQGTSGTVRELVLAGQLTAAASGGAAGRGAAEPATESMTPWQDEDAWQIEHAVDATLSRMKLDPEADFESLSSGMKRRVLLAQAIAADPDLLMLDEPTNHLDLESILWLEDFLARWNKSLIFITHDRSFLQRLATRIWEIDRGRLFDWSCDYATFLQRKEAALAEEEKQNQLFDKKLAEEEAWIRQGIKARRTRNEGRVRALKAMREKRRERRQLEGTAKLNLQQAQRSGALVAELKEVSFSYPDQPIVRDFSTTIMRGDKIGIVGRNGAGKTTLLKLMLGQVEPDSGSVRLGTNLNVAYFDQLRDTLDPEKTVQENVGEGSDHIRVGDQTKHILGYLQDFLFTPERARTEVRFLSGGERNRALLAKLMTRAANVVVLDEPTNDLDSETLEMLEDQLIEFAGTLLLVTHDRTFLNNIATSIIAFEDDTVREYDGGYDDWQAAIQRRAAAEPNEPKRSSSSRAPITQAAKAEPPKKLSYNEQRELASLPERIESLEARIGELHQQMASADFYQRSGDEIAEASDRLQSLEQEREQAYTRWEELES